MKFIIPILSLIISIIALAVALPRPNNLGIDYLGVIVAIISLATAFAVGFQIWNALSLETRLKELKNNIESENIDKINSLEKKLTADFEKKSENLSVEISHKTAITTATIAFTNDHYNDAFYYFVQALENETILTNKFGQTFTGSIEQVITSILDRNYSIQISDPEKRNYIIKTIIDSKNEKLIQRIETIKARMLTSTN